MTHSLNSPPPPDDGASSGSPPVASASGEAPAKKPWSRPTFYVLTDVLESHGAPTAKSHDPFGNDIDEDETIPPSNLTHYKKYRPATA